MLEDHIMHTIDLTNLSDELVIHYGGQLHSVEANTFANSLVSLARIIEEISYYKYPDYKVEIRVEALAEGSFRPLIRLYGKSIISKIGAYLPDKKDTLAILIALFTLYEPKSDKEVITITDNDVTIQKGDTIIIVPRDNYDTAKTISKNKEVKQAISNHFKIIEEDPSIENFGFAKSIKDENFLFLTDRKDFHLYSVMDENLTEERRVIEQKDQALSLLKVILEKGTRKWEFVWNGIRISAPVTDENFWEDMRQRKIVIAQGDSIIADIRIHQILDPYSRIYLNERYEIIKVNQHIKPLKQMQLPN